MKDNTNSHDSEVREKISHDAHAKMMGVATDVMPFVEIIKAIMPNNCFVTVILRLETVMPGTEHSGCEIFSNDDLRKVKMVIGGLPT